MKLNKIVFSVGLLVVANFFVIEAAEVDPLQAQVSLHRALNWGVKGCAVGVANALNDGADPNRRLQAGFPQGFPLYVAARNGNKDVVGLLLEYGAEVNGIDSLRGTPLHGAASRYCSDQKEVDEQLAVMRLLLGAGADVNASREASRLQSYDASIVLQKTSRSESNKALRASRAEAVENQSCITPLSLAAQKRYGDIVRVLLRAGADPSLILSDETRAFVEEVENKEQADLLEN